MKRKAFKDNRKRKTVLGKIRSGYVRHKIHNFGMDGSFFTNYYGNKKNFLGVFAQDQLESLKPKPYNFFVVNLDFSSEPGSHWIGVKFKKSIIEVYDSFGMQISGWYRRPYYLLNFLFKYSNSHSISITPKLQDASSNICGLYCLYFLHPFPSLDKKLMLFSSNRKENDIFIEAQF